MSGPAPLALTMGEPAGIGGEITLKAWQALQARSGHPAPVFFAIDDPGRLSAIADEIGLKTPVTSIATPDEAAAVFSDALPVLPLEIERPITPGRPNPAHAQAVISGVETAVGLALAGDASGVVTNPIHKATLYAAGFSFPGHTEFLGALAERHGHATPDGGAPVMMLACPGLRVVPVTVHQSLIEAVSALSVDRIVSSARVADASLRQDFAIATPRLAVAGLNPHAGEGGSLGREEIEIITPAVERLRAEGIDVSGPASADTLFHPAARDRYDVALCMYHDQALIPLKTIDFEHGVNITLGLPFVRTSPDHGTALDKAGDGRASAASLIAALETAALMAANRARTADPRVA